MKRIFKRAWLQLVIIAAVVGPGLITAFADNDAGGVATYSVAAAKFGYTILTVLIPITVVLAVTQEIGARLAIVTQKGLADLIRERFGIRMTLIVFALLSLVNFGVILQDLSGLKSALQLFHMNVLIFLPLAVAGLFIFIVRASYKRVQQFFLVLILFYGTYFASAILAHPDWTLTLKSLVIPQGRITFDYLFTSVAVLGTTVTAWGQFFINSYVKDKKISAERLKYSQWEIYMGAILTDIFSLFMMVAVAATIFKGGLQITDGAQAALAIKPFAGEFAGMLFGVGLLIAGFLGCAIVPLATAYAFSEFFGFEGSLDENFNKSRLFYLLFLIQVVVGMLIVMMPNVSLFHITLLADFLNGAMLPVIFFFLYKFANNANLMGQYKNTTLQNALLIGSGIAVSAASGLGIVGKLFGW